MSESETLRVASLPPAALDVCRAVRSAGGRAFIVGGYVRDKIRWENALGPPPEPRDIDIEAYGLEPGRLRAALQELEAKGGDSGRILNEVGRSFCVFKLGDVDVSLPRTDIKEGNGHRGFEVRGNPHMTTEEACRRRDFTMNAMLFDPLTGDVIDHFGGREDVQRGLLNIVDGTHFWEDPLRPLRGMQFAARFDLYATTETVRACMDCPGIFELPAERVWGEMEKLLLARKPSRGLSFGLEAGVIDKLFPELAELRGCPQDFTHHPEGDVWTHTLRAVDVAANDTALQGAPRHVRLSVMLATLLHDIGKPATTVHYADGRIASPGHAEKGAELADALLKRLKVGSIDGFDVRGSVVSLVRAHMRPMELCNAEKNGNEVTDRAIRRLAREANIELLCAVNRADLLGRGGPVSDSVPRWLKARALALECVNKPVPPLLLGRDLVALNYAPSPRMGEVLGKVYEAQLDGTVADRDSALSLAKRLYDERVGELEK